MDAKRNWCLGSSIRRSNQSQWSISKTRTGGIPEDFEKANQKRLSLEERRLLVKGGMANHCKRNHSKTRTISVQNGDQIREGMILIDGDVDPHDILKVKGQVALVSIFLTRFRKSIDYRV